MLLCVWVEPNTFTVSEEDDNVPRWFRENRKVCEFEHDKPFSDRQNIKSAIFACLTLRCHTCHIET